MGIEYRLAGRVDPGIPEKDAHEVATREFAGWLAGKNYDASDLTPGRRRVANEVVLLSSEGRPIDGSRTTRLQLRETSTARKQRWISTLTVHTAAPGAVALDDLDAFAVLDDAPDALPDKKAPIEAVEGPATWLALEVEYLPLGDGARPPAPTIPRLARDLLRAVPLLDGDVPLVEDPVYVETLDELSDLVGALGSRRRHLPVLVAAARVHDTRASSLELYGDLSRDLTGFGSLAVISGGMLTSLNEVLGPNLAIRPGQVRTFQPRPRPADPEDALRHRLMGARTATDNVRRAARVLASQPRAQALSLALPPALAALREVGEQTGRAAAQAAANAATTAAAVVSAAAESSLRGYDADSVRWREEPTSATSHAAEALGELRAERDQARRRSDELVERLRELAESVRALQAQVDDLSEQSEEDRVERAAADAAARSAAAERDNEIVEHDATAAGLAAAQDRVRWLEERALGYADYEAKQPMPDSALTDAPAYLSDLLERLDEVPNVIFTADRGAVEALDANLKAGNYARRAWDALLALNDYAIATVSGDWAGNFYAWCKDTPTGRRGLQVGLVALKESQTTMSGFGKYRILPCPPEVDPTRWICMEAHVKVGDGSPPAPRIHFHDDTSGATGKIIVGWLGKHLPNPQTAST